MTFGALSAGLLGLMLHEGKLKIDFCHYGSRRQATVMSIPNCIVAASHLRSTKQVAAALHGTRGACIRREREERQIRRL